MFFIPNIKKGVSVAGLVGFFVLSWLFTTLPDMIDRHTATIISVPDTMLSCTKNEDCSYVETSCSSCCHYKGVRADQVDLFYNQELYPACESYSGAVCDCIAEDMYPVCMKGRCKLRPPKPPAPVYNQ